MRPRDFREALRTGAVEPEVHDGLAGALIETGRSIGEAVALQHRLALDEIGSGPVVSGQCDVSRRDCAA